MTSLNFARGVASNVLWNISATSGKHAAILNQPVFPLQRFKEKREHSKRVVVARGYIEKMLKDLEG